jgi:hypothetical protein
MTTSAVIAQLEQARAQWRDSQDVLLHRIEHAYWQQCEESYHDQLREYYCRRAAHQHIVCRLNQVLYGHSMPPAHQPPLQQQPQALSPARPPLGQWAHNAHNAAPAFAPTPMDVCGASTPSRKRTHEDSSCFQAAQHAAFNKRHHFF